MVCGSGMLFLHCQPKPFGRLESLGGCAEIGNLAARFRDYLDNLPAANEPKESNVEVDCKLNALLR